MCLGFGERTLLATANGRKASVRLEEYDCFETADATGLEQE
jgi:hypothetical protein